MTLKKREEIIKMLECWSSEYGCTGCPLIDQGCFDCGHMPVEISRSILALIKELTEEIKDLEADYDRVYEQAEADIHANMADGGTSCHWCIAGHKRDTVHKMQSMIKEECIAGGIWPAFVARVVENVGKKLLEDME